jgi:hypothetical protein
MSDGVRGVASSDSPCAYWGGAKRGLSGIFLGLRRHRPDIDDDLGNPCIAVSHPDPRNAGNRSEPVPLIVFDLRRPFQAGVGVNILQPLEPSQSW